MISSSSIVRWPSESETQSPLDLDELVEDELEELLEDELLGK